MAKRSVQRQRPWYEDYFGPDYLLIDVQHTTDREVRFLRETLNLKRGKRLLDVGCGYGRHLIPLLKRGVDVVGCDLSAFMLQETVRRLFSANQEGKSANDFLIRWIEKGPRLVRCDTRRLPFRCVFDCACTMFNSLGCFDSEDDNYRMLVSIRQALKPDGLFLIDLVNRDAVLCRNAQKDWYERENAIILENKWFDPIRNRSEIDVTVVDKQGKRHYHHSIRLYSFTELSMLLEAAGFRVVSVFGGFSGETFDLNYDRMLVLARTVSREDS